jgi:tripartite-type tricarboxylate transporter receptor subunit TctC
MTLLKRGRLPAAVAVAIGVAAAGAAHAQQKNFPTKPVRWVTVGAGSQNDLVARIISPKLSELWGQPIIIENRTGAGGAFAASTVAKAQADGYTLLMLSNQFAIGAALHKNLPYDAARDFNAVSQIGYSTSALVVAPSLGVRSIKELVTLANAKSSPLLFATSGAGSGVHMNCERFKLAAGIKAVHVAFKSSAEATIEVVTGRVQFSILPLGPALPFIKDGRLVALGVANPQRSPLLPDVPAIAEALPNYQRDGSYGLLAPAGTPRPVLNQINRDVRRVLEMPEVKDRLNAMGFVPAPSTPEEFDRAVRTDIATFTRVGKEAGLIAK